MDDLKMTNVRIQTTVDFNCNGHEEDWVDSRDLDKLVVPRHSHEFTFWDYLMGEVTVNGETHYMKSGPFNSSPTYAYGTETKTVEEMLEMYGNNELGRRNIETYQRCGVRQYIKHRSGGWYPIAPGDQVILAKPEEATSSD